MEMKNKIKILFFIETLQGGGAEKVLRDLVNEMDQSRFDITVQTLWKENTAQLLDPGIRYRFCYQNRNSRTSYVSRAEIALGLVYPRYIKDTYDIEAAYLESGTTKILASSTNRDAVKLAWVHCNLQKAMRDPASFAAATAKWYARFDRIVCVSETVKASFDELFQHRFASVVLHNVIDEESIRRKAEAPVTLPRSGVPVVCAVGRLVGAKNYLRLLRSHKQLLQDGVAHALWIVGDGPEREKLEAYIADNKLGASVSLWGYRENPYPFVARADLLACSSDYEGLSTFVTEGILLGKPIVATDCGGMAELLGKSEYGMITQLSDDAFTIGMRQMLTDTSLRRHYAEKAAAHAASFSKKVLTQETEKFFFNLLEETSNDD